MTNLSLPNLLPKTNYAIRVRAVNGADVSEWSEKFNFLTISDTDIPNTPANVTWVSTGNGWHGEWDAVTKSTVNDDIVIVRYEVKLTAGGNTRYMSAVASSTGKVTFDLSYEENIAMFFVPQGSVAMSVAAVSRNNIFSSYSTPITAGNPAPAAPANLTAISNFEYVDCKWDVVTDNDLKGYRLYMSVTGPSGTYGLVYDGLSTSYSVPSSYYTTDNYFQVKAYDAFNQNSVASNTAGPVRPKNSFAVDTVPPAIPTGLAVSISNGANGSPGKASITWTVASPDVDLAGFNIRWKKPADTDWQYTSVDKAARAVVVLLETAYANYDAQIRAFDTSANYSAWTASATGTAPANSAPSTPAAPGVSSSTLNIQVTPTGTKAAGGAMEADVIGYEVYASTTTGFTAGPTNMLGFISFGPAMVETFPVPASGGASTQTWYVKVIAVDAGGLKSAPSAQTIANPNLIDAVNIVDASITDAKIQTLSVTKLTAGTGLVNNFTVKSTLTMGASGTNAYIQSYDYVAGTSGYRLTNNSLEVNQGTIKASIITLTDIFANDVGSTMTTISGSIIKTGSIQSTSNTGIGATPLWSIPLNGAATFQNLTVRGVSIVGITGDSTSSLIKSANWSGIGGAGWMIDAAGNAYLNQATVYGNIYASGGTFTGTLQATTITGTQTISGATIQTGSGSVNVVRMSSTGIEVWDSGGTRILNAPTSGGLVIQGNATFSGTITSATVTGVLKTSASGARVEILQTGGYGYVDFYNTSVRTGRITGGGSALVLNGPNTETISMSSNQVYLGATDIILSGGLTTDSAYVSGTLTVSGTATFNSTIEMASHSINGVYNLTASNVVTAKSFVGGNLPTGTGIPNGRWINGASGGDLLYTSHANSSLRYKKEIETLALDPSAVLSVRPVSYEMKVQPHDRPKGYRFTGFIAEELEAAGFEKWLGYDDKGRPDEVDYGKWCVAQQVVIRDQQERIENLERQVSQLVG